MTSARLFSPPITHPLADKAVFIMQSDGSVQCTLLYADRDESSAFFFLSRGQLDDLISKRAAQ